ncbi:hypothetical protein DEFDS_1208 [Deferribacter desulfuricans SSM1]|uniref:histidine kinase n=1 Tax=Deferribacter desulfuricans (strain DSM 14783 / JCM 11476 / NBRC 101012 / SSM1) TaxID=639282 RepID=D3PDK3_DEFDS|nr:response regulator [Deferribacter desulfuricans]BAI80676.1 hypothetical protein DEFDS_1208 [Deferribacter desulfuricans SSM1]
MKSKKITYTILFFLSILLTILFLVSKYKINYFHLLITINIIITSFFIIYFLFQFHINYKKTNEKLLKFKKLNKINIQFLEKINDASSYEDIFKGFIETLIENQIIFAGTGYLYNQNTKRLIIKYTLCNSNDFRKDIEIDYNNFIGRYCIEYNKLFIINVDNFKNRCSYSSGLITFNSFYGYYFPIIFQDEVVGVLECLTLNKIDQEILDLLEDVITHLGISIMQIKLFEDSRKLTKELDEKNRILEAQNRELQAQSEELEAQTEELKVQKIELEEYSKRLNKLQQYKNEFIANMSHELRTPLNSIVGLTELILKNNQLDNELKEKLKIINLSGKQLLNIINDILDLSKIESGKIDLEIEEIDLTETIDYVSNIIKPQCNEKNISFKVIFKAKNYLINTDKYKLTQILLNLLSNSVKYTEENGLIELIIEEDTKYIIIHVKDTGIGIPEDLMQNLFEPFVTMGRKFNVQGTGLGLPLTKKLVNLLGGKIAVKSKVGEGTIFTVYIPKELPQSLENQKDEKDKNELAKDIKFDKSEFFNIKENPQDISGKPKILIADDDILSLNEITKLVYEISEDVNIIRATDGLQTKKLIEKEKPDLILLDLDMPKLSGFNILDYLKQNNISTNIIIITALDLDKKDFESYSDLVKAFFIKGKDNRYYLKNLLNKFLTQYKPPQSEVTSEETNTINKIDKETYNILLVEDNFANRYLVKEILKNYNVNIDEAENGIEALEKLKENKYDLVLLDIQMPQMDGYTTFDKIKNELKLSDLPVIALTARSLKNEIDNFKKLGFSDILIKPLNIEEFLKCIKKWIELRNKN